MRGHSKGLVVLAAGALLLTLASLLLMHGPAPAAEIGSSSQPPRSDAAKANDPLVLESGDGTPEAAGMTPSDPREAASEPGQSAEHAEAAGKEVASETPGRLSISPIDSETREPLERFRVRVASGARLAHRQFIPGSGRLQLVLTPDTYSVLVVSQGYEPTELPSVKVQAGVTTAFDSVRMSPGSARILGKVLGELHPEVQVELIGDGRRPCQACAKPREQKETLNHKSGCPDCGYSPDSTIHAVTANGAFDFENLASGNYALRLLNQENRPIGLPISVLLAASGTCHVELESLLLRMVQVELLDADGASLATEWARRIRDQQLSHRVPTEDSVRDAEAMPAQVLPQSLTFECTFRMKDLPYARSTFIPPGLSTATTMRPSPFGARLLTSGHTGNDDRPRENSGPLRLEGTKLEIEPLALPAFIQADGSILFVGVPSARMSLELMCGPFACTVSIPSVAGTTELQAQLDPVGMPTPQDDHPHPGPKTLREWEVDRTR